MSNLNPLSGFELVNKGITKNQATLPELGLKDVCPTGSWLEQKQIQAAIDARKHLISAERIEKSCSLSHAEWRDNLMLAEVTQKTGGHWQFMGHNVGKQLFLYPEEALFLMEINCLLLKHNDVKVSIQQAYSLLFRDKESLTQYMIYASLSRLGYKVLRHKEVKPKADDQRKSQDDPNDIRKKENGTEENKECNETVDEISKTVLNQENDSDLNKNENESEIPSNVMLCSDITMRENETEENKECKETRDEISKTELKQTDGDLNKKDNVSENQSNVMLSSDITMRGNETEENKECNVSRDEISKSESKQTDGDLNKNDNESENQSNVVLKNSSDENVTAMEVSSAISQNELDSDMNNAMDATSTYLDQDVEHQKSNVYHIQIQKIKNRAFKPSDGKTHKYFKNVPNVLNCQTVSVNVPEKEFIPENIEFHKAVYVLNLKSLKSKRCRRISRSYSNSDEANDSNVRRVRNISEGNFRNVQENTDSPCERFMARFPHLRPINFTRSQPFFQTHVFFPRLFPHIAPRVHFFPRWQNFYRPFYFETTPNPFGFRKRSRDNAQSFHFDSIKRLASRLKGLLRAGLPQNQSLDALNKLIQTYNNRYKSSIRLTDDYEVVDGRTIDTIELDDDIPKNKKPRLDDSYNENLEDIKKLANRLKELELEGKATARHRRAFSSLVRTFNKSFNADIYMNNDYIVSDKRQIILDSSSDSDCEINEPSVSGKKLRNPFNVLKRLSEKNTNKFAHSSTKENVLTDPASKDHFVKSIGDSWLPGKDNFGRPEIPSLSEFIYTDNSIYNYAKYHASDFGNWLELKMAFLSILEDNAVKCVGQDDCRSIIKMEDCVDMVTVMKKLSIIKNCDDKLETKLKIVFDVYNRDVQNFRKTSPPKPHFRVLCFDQSSTLPTGEDIAGLYSKYNDGVLMIFAVVHEGSISYLQIKNVNLPMYLPNTNVT